ncbi:MAG: hypothetical protein QMD03_08310 [Syntrophales bacterium]|nr:hypothetical protein [Syntrophales bacterium]
MKNRFKVTATVIMFVLAGIAGAAPKEKSPAGPGTEEFGLTPKELVQAIKRVETLISKCMREQGFEYIAVDYETVRRGMAADKNMPGLSEEEFINKYGFGIATVYTGRPPQLSTGYCPAKVSLGKQNIQIFKKLSPADQVAYNRALFGENTDVTFAVGLEIEDFSRTGGCTRKAIEQVFKPEQLKATYYNPKDALINKDPRTKAALRKYVAKMREAGFDYKHPDEIEPDIRKRLAAITNDGTIPVEKLPYEKRIALEKLKTYEWNVAKSNFELEKKIFDPVEAEIEREMYSRKIQ